MRSSFKFENSHTAKGERKRGRESGRGRKGERETTLAEEDSRACTIIDQRMREY